MAKIKRIGVLKMASFMGLYGVFIGLLIAILMGIFFSIISILFGSALGNSSGISPLFTFSWFNLFLFPLLSGIVGFISGLIFTPIINLILKIIKGLDFDLEIFSDSSQTQQQHRPQPFQH